MASTCVSVLDVCAIRVAKLTESGAPLPGALNGYVSDAPITLSVTLTLEDGDDLVLKNGCGNIAATYQSPDLIKGVELNLELTDLDAELLGLLTGSTVFMDGGDAIGGALPEAGSSPPPVYFEAWSKAWQGDSQVSHTSTTPDATWIHWVFPLTRWTQGDIELSHDFAVIPVTGKGQGNKNATVDGVWDDFPVAVAAAGGITSPMGWFYDVAAPPAECDYVPVTTIPS